MFSRMAPAPLVAVFLLIGSVSPAAAAESDAIDQGLNACLGAKDAQTTAGMVGCTNQAADLWDARLNEVYGRLMKALDPVSRGQLRAAQRSWLDYRAKDAVFAGGPWRTEAGTIAQLTVASARLEQVRSRVLVLETYASPAY